MVVLLCNRPEATRCRLSNGAFPVPSSAKQTDASSSLLYAPKRREDCWKFSNLGRLQLNVSRTFLPLSPAVLLVLSMTILVDPPILNLHAQVGRDFTPGHLISRLQWY